MSKLLLIFLFASIIIPCTHSTTEWFGDARAHMDLTKLPPFYDIVYDESECLFGLESFAIPEYVYFGEMIAAKPVQEHSLCLQFCLETARCKAVNYFEMMGEKKGFCELLLETQYDNPRLMRPFRKATYYEKIRCRTSSNDDEGEEEASQPSDSIAERGNVEKSKFLSLKKEEAQQLGREVVQKKVKDENVKRGDGNNKSREEKEEEKEEKSLNSAATERGRKTSSETTTKQKSNEDGAKKRATSLRALEQKIHEFSLRMKSRLAR